MQPAFGGYLYFRGTPEDSKTALHFRGFTRYGGRSKPYLLVAPPGAGD